MALKPFTPRDKDLTSSDAFQKAVENVFGERFYDFNNDDWEELFRQYHDKAYPNNEVEIICVTNAGNADLRFRIISQKLAIPDTFDADFHVFPKRKMKPKPLD